MFRPFFSRFFRSFCERTGAVNTYCYVLISSLQNTLVNNSKLSTCFHHRPIYKCDRWKLAITLGLHIQMIFTIFCYPLKVRSTKQWEISIVKLCPSVQKFAKKLILIVGTLFHVLFQSSQCFYKYSFRIWRQSN